MALTGVVRTVVVMTGDSDLVPAFKFARREGLKVYLDSLGRENIRHVLKAHSDLLIGVNDAATKKSARKVPRSRP